MSLLEVARGITPDFPSSAGRPFRTPDEGLLARRGEIVAAARELNAAEATELAARTWRLWMAARDIDGGRSFLGEVLDGREPDESHWRSHALYGDGVFAFWQGARDDVRRRNEEALELAQRFDDAEALALAHLGLSRALLVDDGDLSGAREHAAAACAAAEPFGDAMLQGAVHMHAQSVRLSGDYDEAARLFEQSLALNTRLDAQGMVDVEHHNLGHVEIHRGNVDSAARHFAQVPSSGGDYSKAMANLNEASVAFQRGDVVRARSLLEAAEPTFVGSAMAHLAVDDRYELDWLREQLACWAEGRPRDVVERGAPG
jgi:tetratricopeptide (TPR) repeat protein